MQSSFSSVGLPEGGEVSPAALQMSKLSASPDLRKRAFARADEPSALLTFCQASGHLMTFFYFDDIELGMTALMGSDARVIELTRFTTRPPEGSGAKTGLPAPYKPTPA